MGMKIEFTAQEGKILKNLVVTERRRLYELLLKYLEAGTHDATRAANVGPRPDGGFAAKIADLDILIAKLDLVG